MNPIGKLEMSSKMNEKIIASYRTVDFASIKSHMNRAQADNASIVTPHLAQELIHN